MSLIFLASWALLLGARLWVLGYALSPRAATWLQQASSGAVLLLAFFMISDPMTTPQRAWVRMAYAVLVAVSAFVWQFMLFKSYGWIVVSFLASRTVPL